MAAWKNLFGHLVPTMDFLRIFVNVFWENPLLAQIPLKDQTPAPGLPR